MYIFHKKLRHTCLVMKIIQHFVSDISSIFIIIIVITKKNNKRNPRRNYLQFLRNSHHWIFNGIISSLRYINRVIMKLRLFYYFYTKLHLYNCTAIVLFLVKLTIMVTTLVL